MKGVPSVPPNNKAQDGRKLRRYRKRWKVERTFAWLGNFRRLVVRYERHIKMYQAFFHLACLMIVLPEFCTHTAVAVHAREIFETDQIYRARYQAAVSTDEESNMK